MKLQKWYRIVIGDKVYLESNSLNTIFSYFEKIKKIEPLAYIETTYA